jgi:hypothetical protein
MHAIKVHPEREDSRDEGEALAATEKGGFLSWVSNIFLTIGPTGNFK